MGCAESKQTVGVSDDHVEAKSAKVAPSEEVPLSHPNSLHAVPIVHKTPEGNKVSPQILLATHHHISSSNVDVGSVEYDKVLEQAALKATPVETKPTVIITPAESAPTINSAMSKVDLTISIPSSASLLEIEKKVVEPEITQSTQVAAEPSVSPPLVSMTSTRAINHSQEQLPSGLSPSNVPDRDSSDSNKLSLKLRKQSPNFRDEDLNKSPTKDTNTARVSENDEGELLTVNQYSVEEAIGNGAYGIVYRVNIERPTSGDKLHYAMKVVDKKRLMKKRIGKPGAPNIMDNLKSEIAIWKKVSHPNCLQLVEVIDDPKADALFMISEFVDGGSTMPDRLSCEPLDRESIKDTFYQMICGLQYLHDNQIIHHDIKPGNILKNSSNVVKICDFGLAEILDSVGHAHTNTVGTPAFHSPEIAKGDSYSGYDADVWACGITLYMFYYGRVPFMSPNISELYRLIQEAEVNFPEDTPIENELKDLISGILNKDPLKRYNLNAIKSHPWLESVSVENTSNSGPATLPLRQQLTDEDVVNAISTRWTMRTIYTAKRLSKVLVKISRRKGGSGGELINSPK